MAEYSAWRVADGVLFYTTDKEKAKANNTFSEEAIYGPQLIVIGKHMVVTGLERELIGMDINQTKKIELAPEDAFGQRNPSLVRVMPISEFRKREIDPYPGMRIDVDGTVVTVKSSNSGRVMVDGNHPLAGERLVYEIKVVAKLDSDTDKLKAISERHGIKAASIAINERAAVVSIGEDVEKNADYYIEKSSFAASAFAYMDGIKKIVFEESYARPKEANSIHG